MASKAKTLADLRAAHDDDVIIPRRLSAALTKMLTEGKERHDYEQDFMRAAGVGSLKIGAYREQFASHIVVTSPTNGKKTQRNVWFADAKVAAQACKDYPNAFRPWSNKE